jgi:hypothetical protein
MVLQKDPRNSGNGTKGAQASQPESVQLIGTDAYRLDQFVRSNRDEAEHLRALPDGERAREVHRWIDLGRLVDRRTEAVAEADYISKEVDRLVTNVRSSFETEIRKRFDPDADKSLTRPIVEQAVQVKSVVAEAHRQMQELLKTNFDPNDARSAVAKIAASIQAADKQIANRFDPERRDSVIGRIDERVGGQLATLTKWMSGPEGPFQRLQKDIESLKLEIAKREAVKAAKGEVLAISTRKGIDFEDELEEHLERLAQVHGDAVERTGDKPGAGGSKRGDFVLDLADGLGRIVVTAPGRWGLCAPPLRWASMN